MAERQDTRPHPENLRKGYQPAGEGYIPIERRGYQPNESVSGEILPPPADAIAGDINVPESAPEPENSGGFQQGETTPPSGEPTPNNEP